MNYTKPELVTETAQKWEKHHGRKFKWQGTNYKLLFSLTNTIYPTTGQSVSVHIEDLDTNSQFRITDLLEADGATQNEILEILENRKPKKPHWTGNLKQKNEILENGLKELRDYMYHPKFHMDGPLQGYVNVKDVLLRIQETLNAAHDV